MYVKLLVNRNRYFSTLTVPESFNITDVNATLNISHSHNSDLIAELVAPNGTRVKLFSRVGGATDNFTNTTFDDQANTSITNGSGPFSGSYRPESLLSVLNGIDAAGVEAGDYRHGPAKHGYAPQLVAAILVRGYSGCSSDAPRAFAVGFNDPIEGRLLRAGGGTGVRRASVRHARGYGRGNWRDVTGIGRCRRIP
ncbi:proprotein convertase P-domain-containing protein [Bythopirellula polymerisocia]|uniref:proprotein convertase P-domain-containing protein n=1 Tax=Bythopirellula polymerisocia TaxID=2528003 RepID=UPI0011B3A996|nr:proprotein convertase P-domain-containing protein [Bythopirellula polymerisocia]